MTTEISAWNTKKWRTNLTRKWSSWKELLVLQNPINITFLFFCLCTNSLTTLLRESHIFPRFTYKVDPLFHILKYSKMFSHSCWLGASTGSMSGLGLITCLRLNLNKICYDFIMISREDYNFRISCVNVSSVPTDDPFCAFNISPWIPRALGEAWLGQWCALLR